MRVMDGRALFERFGAELLGAWRDQTPEVQQAWYELAAQVPEKEPS